jgi:hypothetical protein
MSSRKTAKRFVYEGFGFPVVFLNVPITEVRGLLTPKVDYNKLAQTLVVALAHKPARLTGNEIRFIRLHFEMTLQQFGECFDVSHPAVLKWERAGNEPPDIKWPTEKDMRLFILDREHARVREFRSLYQDLRQKMKRASKPIELNLAA